MHAATDLRSDDASAGAARTIIKPQDRRDRRACALSEITRTREKTLPRSNWRAGIDRRRLVKSGAALAAAQFASPFVIRARAADPVRIGLDNPLTGTYAAPGKNELIGCQMALDEINAKGGILGRPVELVVEDSTSGDAGTGGAEGAQADRRRQGRFSARQRQLGARARHGAGLERKGHPAYRARRPHRRDHRRKLPLERVPGLQHHADGGERRRRRPGQGLRQEVLLHHARLRLWPHAGDRDGQGDRRAGRREGRRRSGSARQRRFLVLPHQGAGG